MNQIIASLALMATTATAETITLTDKDLSGGDISHHYNRVQDFNARGVGVRLDSQAVISAGTFYLMVSGACVVSSDTVFEFHGPGQNIASILSGHKRWGSAEAKREWIIGEMQAFYNSGYPGMGDWFYSRASEKRGLAVTKVRASELSRAFGVRICEE